MDAQPPHFFLSGVALLLLLLFAYILHHRRGLPLPPSPDAIDVSSGQPWRIYASLSQKLGPIVSLARFGGTIIILNSARAVNELLDNRSNFACKPRWPMADLLGRQRNVGFAYYGSRLKKLRKALHASLNANAVESNWRASLEEQSVQLCKVLLEQRGILNDIVENHIEENMVKYTYGHMPNSDFKHLTRQVMHQTSIALQPGRWTVNFIPALAWVPAWMPGAEFQRWAKQAKELFLRSTQEPFLRAKEDIVAGTAITSFVKASLERLTDTHTAEEENIVMDAASSFFSAGKDTLVAAIITFIALMVRHQDIQERGYEEIKRVVGPDRLPGLNDREMLPYVDAIMKEALRINPPVPLVTHSNVKDDTYCGFRIPKKSWVLANVWGILHDESNFSAAHTFTPDRFLPTGSTNSILDPTTLVYGFGRRRCPGIHFADMMLYLTIVRSLSLCKFVPETQDGKPYIPSLEVMTALIAIPPPFRCKVEPRPFAQELLTVTG